MRLQASIGDVNIQQNVSKVDPGGVYGEQVGCNSIQCTKG